MMTWSVHLLGHYLSWSLTMGQIPPDEETGEEEVVEEETVEEADLTTEHDLAEAYGSQPMGFALPVLE